MASIHDALDSLDYEQDETDQAVERFLDVQDGQNPVAVTVECSDSRVLGQTDEPGDLFFVRNIGNRTYQETDRGKDVSEDVMYTLASHGMDTTTAVVQGHTGCGAVTAAYLYLEGEDLGKPEQIEEPVAELAGFIEDGYDQLPEDISDEEAINRLVEYNVDQQVDFLQERWDELQDDHALPDIDVVGAVYDLHGTYDIYQADELGFGKNAVVNVNGDRDPVTLSDQYSELARRVQRHWEY